MFKKTLTPQTDIVSIKESKILESTDAMASYFEKTLTINSTVLKANESTHSHFSGLEAVDSKKKNAATALLVGFRENFYI